MSKIGPSLAWVLACALALLLTPLADPAHAAPFKRKGEVSLKSTYEPNEALPGDIVLPLPEEGLSMVFRLVAVPVKGATGSLDASFGLVSTADGRAFYDSSRRLSISAPFETKDLPADWLASVPAKMRSAYRYYLIAKYEVSRRQYKAVMGSCPDVSGQKIDDNRPVTNLSWYDAMAFTSRCTRWLLENHPDLLPHPSGVKDETGYLRLPTEAEWEYAALGGHTAAKPGSQMTFFVEGENLAYDNYAFYQGGDNRPSSLAAIGSRQASPLGLYDTAGNAAEMTLDSFRFSVAGTLQGAAGGFMRKGGSFLSQQDEILPGCREEVPPFNREGVMRQSDLGFRPVISGMSLTDVARQEAAKDISTAMAASRGLDDSALIKELTALIKQSGDESTRANLTALRGQLEENRILAERTRMAAIESRLQNCLMTLKAATYYKYRLGVNQMKLTYRRKLAKNNPKDNPEKAAMLQERVAESEQHVATFERYIDSVLKLYINNYQKLISEYPQKDVTQAIKNLEKGYGKGKADAWKTERALLGLMGTHLKNLCQGKRVHSKAVRDQLDRLKIA